MSLIHKSLDQLRRNQAGPGDNFIRLGSGGSANSGKTRVIILVSVAVLVAAGLGVFAGANLFMDYFPNKRAKAIGNERSGAAPGAFRAKAAGQEKNPDNASMVAARYSLPGNKNAGMGVSGSGLDGSANSTFRGPAGTDQAEALNLPQHDPAPPAVPPVLPPLGAGLGQAGTGGPDTSAALPGSVIPGVKAQRAPVKARDEFNKDSESLENHFIGQARKNQRVLALERGLSVALKSGDMAGARSNLTKLIRMIGTNSLSAHKWRGFMAMAQKDWPGAETHYRKAVTIRPNDIESQYNLIVSLMKQDKKKDASLVFRNMKKYNAADERVISLAPVFKN